LPQELSIARVVGLEVAVRLAVEQHVRSCDQRAAALPCCANSSGDSGVTAGA
jgi:hypothetical protein